MRSEQTLRSREGFRRVMGRGRNARSNGVRVHYALNGLEHSRYGIAATTKVGGAVQRNRVRRWARELLRRWEPALASGFDVVVFVSSPEVLAGYGAFAGHLAASLDRAQLAEGPLEAR